MALFLCPLRVRLPLWRACGAAFGLAGLLVHRFANPARPPPLPEVAH